MSGKPQLFTKDVERGLKALSLTPRPQKGTSHIHWVGQVGGKFRKVTVDPHLAPYSDDLVSSMAKQAGVTKKQFYEVCSKSGAKAAKRGRLSWFTDLFKREAEQPPVED